MRKHLKIIDSLIKIAIDENNEERDCRANHVSCLVLKNTTISYGFNQMKSHPFQAKYSKHEEAIFWHAEVHAIHNALKRISEEDLKKATLYVVRVKSEDDRPHNYVPAMSKPCPGCMRAIKDYGIREVIYTEDFDGDLIYSTIAKQ